MSQPALDTSPDATLARVQAAFTPGALGAKRDELARLREYGDTMLFEGAVDWTIFLTDTDRRMSGGSENLDAAVADLIACLDHLAQDTDLAAEILIGVQLAEETAPA